MQFPITKEKQVSEQNTATETQYHCPVCGCGAMLLHIYFEDGEGQRFAGPYNTAPEATGALEALIEAGLIPADQKERLETEIKESGLEDGVKESPHASSDAGPDPDSFSDFLSFPLGSYREPSAKDGRFSFRMAAPTDVFVPFGFFHNQDGHQLGEQAVTSAEMALTIAKNGFSDGIMSPEEFALIEQDIKESGLPEKNTPLDNYTFRTEMIHGEMTGSFVRKEAPAFPYFAGVVMSKSRARYILDHAIEKRMIGEDSRESLLEEIEASLLPEIWAEEEALVAQGR